MTVDETRFKFPCRRPLASSMSLDHSLPLRSTLQHSLDQSLALRRRYRSPVHRNSRARHRRKLISTHASCSTENFTYLNTDRQATFNSPHDNIVACRSPDRLNVTNSSVVLRSAYSNEFLDDFNECSETIFDMDCSPPVRPYLELMPRTHSLMNVSLTLPEIINPSGNVFRSVQGPPTPPPRRKHILAKSSLSLSSGGNSSGRCLSPPTVKRSPALRRLAPADDSHYHTVHGGQLPLTPPPRPPPPSCSTYHGDVYHTVHVDTDFMRHHQLVAQPMPDDRHLQPTLATWSKDSNLHRAFSQNTLSDGDGSPLSRTPHISTGTSADVDMMPQSPSSTSTVFQHIGKCYHEQSTYPASQPIRCPQHNSPCNSRPNSPLHHGSSSFRSSSLRNWALNRCARCAGQAGSPQYAAENSSHPLSTKASNASVVFYPKCLPSPESCTEQQLIERSPQLLLHSSHDSLRWAQSPPPAYAAWTARRSADDALLFRDTHSPISITYQSPIPALASGVSQLLGPA